MFQVVTSTDPCAGFQSPENPVAGASQVAVDVVQQTLQDNPWIKWVAVGVGVLILINLFKKK